MIRDLFIKNGSQYSDQYYQNVSLLLNGDGANGAQNQTFVDSSTNNATITRYGDTTQGSFSPFGTFGVYGGSAYFDGTGDYLTGSITGGVGSGDFTAECWINTNYVASGDTCVFDTRSGTTTDGFTFDLTGSTNSYMSIFTNSRIITSNILLPKNQWVHYAFVRVGSTFTLYQNGINVGTASAAGYNMTNASYKVGFSWVGSAFNGYISNLRVIKGTALYTSNFTPSTTPLTAVANTSLLLKCDNAGIIDASGKNNLVTYGNAQVSTAVKKYGTGAMYFDGTGDYLTAPNSTAFDLSSNTFTIEALVYQNSNTGTAIYSYIVDKRGGGGTWGLFLDSGVPALMHGSSMATVKGTTAIPLNTWTHIAASVSSGTVKIFIDGVQTWTASGLTFPVGTADLWIGRPNTYSYYFNGYIDDLRITKGVARYTANFTPPTSALTL